MQRQLRLHLAVSAADYRLQLQPVADSVRLQLIFDSFHGTADGYAVLSGHFSLSHQAQPHAFNLRVALADDGYPALVSALGQGVAELSEQIVQQLQ